MNPKVPVKLIAIEPVYLLNHLKIFDVMKAIEMEEADGVVMQQLVDTIFDILSNRRLSTLYIQSFIHDNLTEFAQVCKPLTFGERKAITEEFYQVIQSLEQFMLQHHFYLGDYLTFNSAWYARPNTLFFLKVDQSDAILPIPASTYTARYAYRRRT